MFFNKEQNTKANQLPKGLLLLYTAS